VTGGGAGWITRGRTPNAWDVQPPAGTCSRTLRCSDRSLRWWGSTWSFLLDQPFGGLERRTGADMWSLDRD